jgi:hypothetical protein
VPFGVPDITDVQRLTLGLLGPVGLLCLNNDERPA